MKNTFSSNECNNTIKCNIKKMSKTIEIEIKTHSFYIFKKKIIKSFVDFYKEEDFTLEN